MLLINDTSEMNFIISSPCLARNLKRKKRSTSPNLVLKTGEVLPMTIIKQTRLFGIQELYDMEPTQKYDAIISTISNEIVNRILLSFHF